MNRNIQQTHWQDCLYTFLFCEKLDDQAYEDCHWPLILGLIKFAEHLFSRIFSIFVIAI